METPSIKDLRREDPGSPCYVLTLPDGRTFRVAKVPHDKFSLGRGGIVTARRVAVWAWEVFDPEAEVLAQEKGMATRAAAFERGIRWARENRKGTVVA